MSTSTERMRRLRERRAAEIEAGEPRDRAEDDLLAPAVRKSLEALEAEGILLPEDAAMGQLAYVLALAIDRADKPAAALRWLGPELIKALESLGGSPAARARLPKRERPRQPSKLDELRARRVQRPPGALSRPSDVPGGDRPLLSIDGKKVSRSTHRSR